MKKRTRFVIILAVLAVCFGFLWPSLSWYKYTDDEQQKLALMSREEIRDYAKKQAGDLAVKIAKQVEENKSLDESESWLIDVATKKYKDADKDVPENMNAKAVVEAFKNNEFVEAFKNNEFMEALEKHYRDPILANKSNYKNSVKLGLDLSGGTNLIVKVDLDSLNEEIANKNGKDIETAKKDAMTQAVETLTTRLDKFGLSSPVIRQQGDDRIYIEIPGEEKSESINSIIMAGASLNFRLVNEEATSIFSQYFSENSAEFFDDMGKLISTKDGSVDTSKVPNFPEDALVYGVYDKDSYGLDELKYFVAVNKEIAMDGKEVESVTVNQNSTNRQLEVNFELTAEGARIFEEFTGAHVGERLAIVSDNKVKSAANINDRIGGGRVSLTGGFSREEAINIQKVLQTPSLGFSF